MRAAVFLGAADVQVLAFTDTRLSDHETEMVDAIEAEIRRFNPDIIFTHSSNDQHRTTGPCTWRRCAPPAGTRRSCATRARRVTGDFVPSVFVDIEDYVDVKVAAVAVHHDQLAKSYMSPERVRGLAVHRGSQAKVRYAEGYEPVRVLGSPLVEL